MQPYGKIMLKNGSVKTYKYKKYSRMSVRFLEIINFIWSNKGEKMTFSSLQKETNTTYTGILALVKIMESMKIVKLEKVGREVMVSPEPLIRNFTTHNLGRIKEKYYDVVEKMA